MIEKLEKGEASLFYVLLGSWQAGGIYALFRGDWAVAVAVVHIKGGKEPARPAESALVQGYK